MVYERTADGGYAKVGAMELNGSYSDTEGDYAFYWSNADKTLCAFRFSTCTATSFAIPFSEEVKDLRVSDGGYLMLSPVPETEGARIFWYVVDLTAWF